MMAIVSSGKLYGARGRLVNLAATAYSWSMTNRHPNRPSSFGFAHLAGLLAALAPALVGCAHDGPEPASPPTAEAATPLQIKSFAASEKGVHVTSTLVLGEREAVLIDAQFIESEAQRLVEMVRESGRTLTTIYITHAHPDHHFGLPVLHEAFPDARVLAHPLVAAEMRSSWQAKHDQWKGHFGDDLADTQVAATPYDAATLPLEGHTLQLIGPQQGDAEATVSVFVPDRATLIASDVSYAGTHVWLADTTPSQWQAWLATLERLQALQPTVVVSGHRAPGHADDPADLAATAQYIRDFAAVATTSPPPGADGLIATMTSRYPTLKLPIVLQIAAGAASAH
jgi:glyoxylase-like metal-dependent hydrolase (beta-lactamase superfamily II)